MPSSLIGEKGVILQINVEMVEGPQHVDNKEIEGLLKNHRDVFDEPRGLHPSRNYNHKLSKVGDSPHCNKTL